MPVYTYTSSIIDEVRALNSGVRRFKDVLVFVFIGDIKLKRNLNE